MVVAGDHVLGAEIGKDQQCLAGITLEEFGVAARYTVCQQSAGEKK